MEILLGPAPVNDPTEVRGPRDGKLDPEWDFDETLPELTVEGGQGLAGGGAGHHQHYDLVDASSIGPHWKEIRPNNQQSIANGTIGPINSNGNIKIEKPMDGMLIADHDQREQAWKDLAKRMYDRQPSFMDRGKERWSARITYNVGTDRVCWNGRPLPDSQLWKSTFDHVAEEVPGAKKTHLGGTIMVLMEKNEGKIIERMLESVIHDIDGFIILDTGSTDGTEAIMWEFLVTKHGKRGAIYKSDWYDFGTNRTITVQLAQGRGDWLLLMDADYRLAKENRVQPQAWKTKVPPLQSAPAQLLLKTTGDLDYARPHLVRGEVLWGYVCRTHEYLAASKHSSHNASISFRQDTFSPLLIDHVGDGCSKADKLGRDIVLLLMDRMDDPKSERAGFYLANTLKQLRMVDWALREYKMAMNLCAWNEELMCSAKGALDCLFMKQFQTPGSVTFERMFAMALHGMTQNKERLEIPCMFLRKLRNTPVWWPRYAHLACSVASFFTHNVYPSHQRLFIERPDHEFGWWQEISICAFYNPIYFELGAYMAHRIPTLPAFTQQSSQAQKQALQNLAMYDQKLNALRKNGVKVTKPIRQYLMDQGHKAVAQQKFTKAQEWYQLALHAVVLKDSIPEELYDTNDTTSASQVVDTFLKETYHKYHRLTAWQNAAPLSWVQTEIESDRALACFQLGQCMAKQIHDSNKNDKWGGDLIVAAMYYVDALKYVPNYPPALHALYDMTIHRPSDLSRCIMYLIRLTSAGQMSKLAMSMMQPLKIAIENMVQDQSINSSIVRFASLPNTKWICPLPRITAPKKSTTTCDPAISSYVTSSKHVNTRLVSTFSS